jgi:hypothetical protein
MKLIAHRALMQGPDAARENHPDQIQLALQAGLDVELDVRYLHGEFWLGHDVAQYKVELWWLLNPRFWLHCKNLQAMHELSKTTTNFFWHQNDDVTLTSKGWLWTQPGRTLFSNSVAVVPETHVSLDQFASVRAWPCHAICTDYCDILK